MSFETAVRSLAIDLIEDPGNAGHVHFSDPMFKGIVPPFTDLLWIELTQVAATILTDLSPLLMVHLPLASSDTQPGDEFLNTLRELDPWTPPGIYALTAGSSFPLRKQAAWYTEEVTKVEGALGWCACYISDEAIEEQLPPYRVSLFYETVE